MKQSRPLSCIRFSLLLLFLPGLVLVGCSKQPAAQPTAESSGYNSTLTTDYDGALDVPTQLALGTLRLQETDLAVTAGQATSLLTLWQSLQSGAITSDSERSAVFKQIEKTMTYAQLAAIRAMQLTQADLTALNPGGGMPPQDGTIPQGTGRQGQGRQGFDANAIAARRAQMETMSEQERQQMFSQFQRSGAAASGNTALNMVIASLIRLLVERSGQAMALPPGTPMPPDETPVLTDEPTQTPTATTTLPTEPAPADVEPTATAMLPAGPTSTPASAAVPTAAVPTAAPNLQDTVNIPTLTPIEDTDPGPPFTILISSNTAEQDPLVEGSKIYRITGLVRNDSTQTYDVSAIHVTFFNAEGFRGTFTPAVRDGKVVGGEWNWYGEMQADFSALLLAPGEAWPFSIAITAQNMASFLVHPDAVVATREPVEVSGIRVVQDSTGFIRLTGTATNTGAATAKNVTVAGALLDASEQIVSVGSTLVVQDSIAPGASVKFDLRVEKQAYVTYQLYAQAERDWE